MTKENIVPLTKELSKEDVTLLVEGMTAEFLPDITTAKLFKKWGFDNNGKPVIHDWAEDYHRGCCDEF